MENVQQGQVSGKKPGLSEVLGVSFVLFGILTFLAVLSYNITGQERDNLIGAFGGFTATYLNFLFGSASFFLGPYLILMGLMGIYRGTLKDPIPRIVALPVFMFSLAILLSIVLGVDQADGGLIGQGAGAFLSFIFGPVGGGILAAGVFITTVILTLRLPVPVLIESILSSLSDLGSGKKNQTEPDIEIPDISDKSSAENSVSPVPGVTINIGGNSLRELLGAGENKTETAVADVNENPEMNSKTGAVESEMENEQMKPPVYEKKEDTRRPWFQKVVADDAIEVSSAPEHTEKEQAASASQAASSLSQSYSGYEEFTPQDFVVEEELRIHPASPVEKEEIKPEKKIEQPRFVSPAAKANLHRVRTMLNDLAMMRSGEQDKPVQAESPLKVSYEQTVVVNKATSQDGQQVFDGHFSADGSRFHFRQKVTDVPGSIARSQNPVNIERGIKTNQSANDRSLLRNIDLSIPAGRRVAASNPFEGEFLRKDRKKKEDTREFAFPRKGPDSTANGILETESRLSEKRYPEFVKNQPLKNESEFRMDDSPEKLNVPLEGYNSSEYAESTVLPEGPFPSIHEDDLDSESGLEGLEIVTDQSAADELESEDESEFFIEDDPQDESVYDNEGPEMEDSKTGEEVPQPVTAEIPAVAVSKERETRAKDPVISAVPPLVLKDGRYYLPPELLDLSELNHNDDAEEEIEITRQRLEQVLQDYGIHASVVDTRRGPIITLYEIKLEPGMRVSRVLGINDEIKMNLEAQSLRIVAPIPGKSTIGIEIPNRSRDNIKLGDLARLDDNFFSKSRDLTVVLGKNISGSNVYVDLARLPHLLIAGATGAGKSVYMNSVIASLLYNRSPEELRFIMIDPKMVELKLFEGIPHLLMPVITDVKMASKALSWVVAEMERRYTILSRARSRDIRSYNERVSERSLFSGEEGNESRKMPYIILLIDELSDLMMVSAREVEESIIRLTQKARAVGIHVIMATQRPSVDVITALIKANCPARISFHVAQKTDSRTILDSNGAEALLGRGDMLYKSPTGTVPERLHAPLITEQEIEKIVRETSKFGKPRYVEMPGDDDEGYDSEENEEDELFEAAWNIVLESGKTSTSYVQRRLRIGYNRAANLIELMEQKGYLSAAMGNKPREILKRS